MGKPKRLVGIGVNGYLFDFHVAHSSYLDAPGGSYQGWAPCSRGFPSLLLLSMSDRIQRFHQCHHRFAEWDNPRERIHPGRSHNMPNNKQRKKKGGRNKSKKLKAMRLSIEERRANRRRPSRRGPFRKGLSDQPDIQEFKPGASNDRYSRQAE
ncbi:hypothetical protein COMA2_50216 [Candidatus Nitrospira nitrificans]|uniref:Uncharacterized protein n=2 Tax=Candidatus Nitrospira nitrificans TaxID=1742973 RepID=A0A0S4LRU7_9BACT|nr:hypothetical protein COMA2_50216 [Candidatus Nitrospira nitrificans]